MRRTFAGSLLLLTACAAPVPVEESWLAACDDRFGASALCGWHSVPEDRANLDSRQIDLRVVVLPARSEPRGEPVLLFPGGPGQATTDLVNLASAYPGIRRSRDLIFIGQRGTGESNALHCAEGIEEEPSRAFGQLFDAESVRTCRTEASTHADPSFYTTEEYVADIADVLDVLEHRRALLWGGSGGTRTALAFMRAHGERVVAAVLDGVTSVDAAMPSSFARYAQTAWERVVADCADQSECAAAFPDLNEDFEGILRQLGDQPVATSITQADGSVVEVSFNKDDFAYGIRGILYNAGQIAQLPGRITRASQTGDFTAFAQAHYDRSVALRSNVIAMGLHLTVYCAEDVPRIDRERERASAEGTFLGGYAVDQYSAACEEWTVTPKSADWYRPVQSDAPVLLLSGYYDPSTPAESADRVAEGFSSFRHLVVRNVGHGAGFNCARPVVEQFLVAGSFAGFENPCPDTPVTFETP